MVSREAIDGAIAAHGQWRKRLEEAIAQGTSEWRVSVVQKDDACHLGQWLRSLLPGDRAADHFEQVMRLHAEFHETAAQILDLALRGAQPDAAQRMEFGNEYTLASGRLVLALNRWKNSLP